MHQLAGSRLAFFSRGYMTICACIKDYSDDVRQLTNANRYSPRALAGSREDLEKHARILAAEAKELVQADAQAREGTEKSLEEMKPSTFVEVLVKGDEVKFHATMTLVYQAIPSLPGSLTRFCDECLTYARKAMSVHQECVSRIDPGSHLKSIYIHW